MRSKWKKVRDALQSRVGLGAKKAKEGESNEFDVDREIDGGNKRDSSGSPLSSFDYAADIQSSTFSNRISSTKNMCGICLGTLKPGDGDAIFTAECSHTFHFRCIAASDKLTSKTCPICRANWKHIPSRDSLSRPSNNADFNSRWMFIIRPLPTSRNHNPYSNNEPESFSDDEELQLLQQSFNKGDPTEKIEVRLLPEFPCVMRSSSHENFAVLIHMKAPFCATKRRASVDLISVIDTSGSMAGTKLALVIKAMSFVVQNLGSSDRLSIIVFSSTARRVFPLRRMTQIGKQDALRALNSLSSSGGTNIADGILKAAKVIASRRLNNQVASVMLLSDGRDTQKVNGESTLKTGFFLPESLKNSGVPVHTFGFGADHDTQLMHSISESSGGTFSFIEAENTIQDAFALCIGGLLSVIAQRLRVTVKLSDSRIRISSLNAGCYPTTLSEKEGEVDVGDLSAEEERDFLLTLDIPVENQCRRMPLLEVQCSYRDPVTKETVHLETGGLHIDRPDFIDEQKVSIEVDRQRNRLLVSEAIAGAMVEAEKGNMQRARMILSSCRRSLLQSAAFGTGDGLCASLCHELKEMDERMASRHVYESSGRAYMFSGWSSHSSQRATARGNLSESHSALKFYQTPSMAHMISRSASFTMQSH